MAFNFLTTYIISSPFRLLKKFTLIITIKIMKHAVFSFSFYFIYFILFFIEKRQSSMLLNLEMQYFQASFVDSNHLVFPASIVQKIKFRILPNQVGIIHNHTMRKNHSHNEILNQHLTPPPLFLVYIPSLSQQIGPTIRTHLL